MKKGKRIISVIVGMALVFQSFAGVELVQAEDEVVIADTFTDANFREYVKTNFDTNGDEKLSAAEIAAVTTIDVTDLAVVRSMKGVEVFTALKILVCSGQALTALDVTGLEQLMWIDASSNQLQRFVLPKNAPNLTYVDVSDNYITSLTSLSDYKQLQVLYVGYNNLTNLDLSQLTDLTSLSVSGNGLTSLDLSANSKLESLYCYNMTALSELNVATTEEVDHTSLKTVGCGYLRDDGGRGSITKIDVSGDSALETLEAKNNSISTLDIMGVTSLLDLDVSDNKLTALNVAQQTQLKKLDASSNNIETLDVTNNKELLQLFISSMALVELDVTQNTKLTELQLANNNLSQIDISQNTALTKLDLSSNQLQRIDVAENTELTDLNLDGNHLVAVDISNCSNLKNGGFSCTGNTRDIILAEPDFNFNLADFVEDGFVKEKEDAISRGDDYEGDACIQTKALTSTGEIKETVVGAEISAYNLWAEVDAKQVKYNYYYGWGKNTVQFTLNIANPLTLHVWAEADGKDPVTNNEDGIKLKVGEKVTLKAKDDDGNLLQKITWSTSDENVAEIDANTGEFVCKKPGNVTVYAHINQKPRVYVEFSGHNPVSTVNLLDSKDTTKAYSNGDVIEMEAGTYADSALKTKKLTPKCYDVEGELVDSEFSGIKYTVTDSKESGGKVTSSVITCSTGGQISAKAAGTAYLHCVSEDSGAETVLQINVTRRVDSISVSSTKLSMFTGDTKEITASVSPATAANQDLHWESNNEAIATVDQNGKITAKGEGTAEITCTADDNASVYSVTYVTVKPAADNISLNHSAYELTLGTTDSNDRTVTLEATIEAADESIYKCTWTSSDTAVATVSSLGVVTAKGPGEATITCSISDTRYATCRITVVSKVTAISIVNAEGITISSSQKINVNDTMQLTAVVKPVNATNQAVWWTSSDTSVATISNEGLITALRKGETTITCNALDGNQATKYFTLYVLQPVEEVTIDKSAVTVYTGKTETVTATVVPENASNPSLLWLSDDTAVATVSNGRITGISAGTTTVRCTTKDGTNLSKEIQVAVLQQIKKITLNQTTADMLAGKTLKLTATIEPTEVTNSGLIWTSNNEAAATVSQDGTVTAVGSGKARITCTAADGQGAKAYCDVVVTQLVSSITLSDTAMNVGIGKTTQIKATVAPETATNKSLTWTSSNEKVATVTSSGYVKGIAKGVATITCTAKDGSGKSASCKVSVVEPVTGIKLNATSKTLLVGKSSTLKATVTPTSASIRGVTWSTSNKKVATVSSKGVVKAVGKGTATIYCEATDGSGIKVSCQVTVKIPVKKITLNKKSLKLKLKKTYTLKAKATPTNAANKSVSWKSSNKKIVTVTQSGKITAKKKGKAYITAKAKDGSGKYAKCLVRVY